MIAEDGCWERLLRRAADKAAEKSCWEKLLTKAAEKSCGEKLLKRAAEKSCRKKLLRKAAEKSCWEKGCSSKMLLLLKIYFFFRRVGLVDWIGRQPSRHFVLVGRTTLWIFHVAEQPSTQKVNVGRWKLWWNANFLDGRATFNAKSQRRTLKTAVNANFTRARATLNAKSDRPTLKTVAKCKFYTCPSNL